MTNEEMIQHVKDSVMNINATMFAVHFGKSADQVWKDANIMPGVSQDALVNALKDHVEQYMLSDPDNIETLYSDLNLPKV